MRRLALLIFICACLLGLTSGVASATSCGGGLSQGNCGVGTQQGEFHGLIALSEGGSLLQTAAHSGTKPGCGDCVWTVLEYCPGNEPGGAQTDCKAAHHYPGCRRRQLAERIFLSTDSQGYEDVGVYCLGGGNHIVPVGDDAIADVDRYLKNVRPPGLAVHLDPGTSLAGLATKVRAGPPGSLRPTPFGGPTVTETITLHPATEMWRWGDGQSDTLTPDKAGVIATSHTYGAGGHLRTDVTTTWGATYTVTYQGATFGPYDAIGTLTRTQSAPLTVVTSNPVLISHG